jgi:excisionase family DNA binding protein
LEANVFYTVREAAALLRVTPDALRRAIRRGRVPVKRIGRGQNSIIRVPADWLMETIGGEEPDDGVETK